MIVGWTALVIGLLIVVGGVWVIVTAVLARSQLVAARDGVARVRADLLAGRVDAARADLSVTTGHAHRARFLTSGPAWAVAANVPGAGPFETVRGVASGVDDLASVALPALVSARQSLDPDRLRRRDGSFDLAVVAAGAPELRRADDTTTAVVTRLHDLPRSTWLKPADRARAQLLTELDAVAEPVHQARVAADVVPTLLGDDRPRRYFVAFQNEAEARGTGGIPGAFAIAQFDHGRIRFLRFESDTALEPATSGLSLGRDYDQLWGAAQPNSVFINGNVSPNFPYAARIWTAMWQRRYHQRLDGAIAVDPTALGYLLSATGPARLSDGETVSGANVADLVQRQLYARYPSILQNGQRRARLVAIARAASDRLVAPGGSNRSLLSGLRRGLDERRIVVWTADTADQKLLATTPAAGTVETTTGPFVGPVIVNDVGGKLDYYLDRDTTWTRKGCGAQRSVTVSVRLTNTAPGSGLPPYVTYREDHARVALGDSHVRLVYYATSGARLTGATLDGVSVPVQQGDEQGHPVVGVPVELPHGRSRTVVLTLVEPAGDAPPAVLDQPLARPQRITVADTPC